MDLPHSALTEHKRSRVAKLKCCALALYHQIPYVVEALMFCIFFSFCAVGLTCRLTLPQLETFSVGPNASTAQHTAYERITKSITIAKAYEQCEQFMGDRPEDSVYLFFFSLCAFVTYPFIYELVIFSARAMIGENCRCTCDPLSIKPIALAEKTLSRVVVVGAYNLPVKNNGEIEIRRSCRSKCVKKNSITQHLLGLFFLSLFVKHILVVDMCTHLFVSSFLSSLYFFSLNFK